MGAHENQNKDYPGGHPSKERRLMLKIKFGAQMCT